MPKNISSGPLQQTGLSKLGKSLLLAGGALLILLANLFVWLNRTVFDTANFSSLTTESLTSEQSRRAIANSVVDRALTDRPILNSIAGDELAILVTAILGSNQAQGAIERLSAALHAYIVSDSRTVVTFDLVPLKETIALLAGIAGRQGSVQVVRVEDLPDSVVLLDRRNVPSLHGIKTLSAVAAPIAVLGGTVLLGTYAYLRREQLLAVARRIGIALGAAELVSLVIIASLKPVVVANVPNPDMQSILASLTSALTAPLQSQSVLLLVLGIALVVISLVWRRGKQCKGTRS